MSRGYLFFSLVWLNLTSLPIATVSRIIINVVIFCSWHIFQSTRTSDNCVWFYSKHLFYNDPDTAYGIGFDQQRSLPFFSSGFSLEILARFIFFYVYSCWSFHLSWNLFALLFLESSLKDV
jgi:hypothetical protein